MVNLVTGAASGFASIAGIENVTGGSGDDMLTGDALVNALSGGSGNDRFVAAVNDGNDALSGGAGIDTYDLSPTAAAAIVTTSSATSAQIGTDSLASIENVIGSQGNDTITTAGGTNVIDGQAGDDTLDGGTGNDTLDGGADNDTLIGGAGNDILLGGTGNDTFTYTFGNGADTVDGGGDTDTLNIIGTTGNNTLDVIFDGTSITNFEGGTVTGVEAINADLLDGTDTLTYAGTTADIVVNLATGAASGFASITGIENVTGGSGNDTLTWPPMRSGVSCSGFGRVIARWRGVGGFDWAVAP